MKPAPEAFSRAGFAFRSFLVIHGISAVLYCILYCTFYYFSSVVTITPLLNYRGKTNKSGLYSIHLRITIRREQRYYKIKLPQKVSRIQWSGENDRWVRNTHPDTFEINNRIQEKKNAVMQLVKRCYTLNKAVTFHLVEREFSRKGDRAVLNDYVENFINRPPDTVVLTEVTWEKYKAFQKHLNEFQSRIVFSEIDENFIARFRKHLATRKGRDGKLSPATIQSYFDKFKVILNYAARKDYLLDPQELKDFFGEVKITVPRKKEGQHLEVEEIKKLRDLKFTEREPSLRRDRDLFLFQVYTGLYYSDLVALRKDQLFRDVEHGYYIIGERDKNGNPTIIPLFKFPYATTIIENYRDRDEERSELFSYDSFVEVQVYNRNLKLLATKAGIFRTMSNKTARHTNAQLWVHFGAERPVPSKMLRHEAEHTTENYYRVGLHEVIEGTKSINFEKFEI